MRDSTVLIVLLLTTLGSATGALNVTATEETCSNITISWTAMDNRNADFTIRYNSTVHSDDVDYVQDVSPRHTTKVTNLVADTEYNITVTAMYSDNTTASGTVTANTKSGTPSNNAISTTSTGSTSLSFKVEDPGGSATYNCWVNSTDHRLNSWTQGTITTVSGLDPETYYNITCQKRPNRIQTCPITHAVVATKPNPPANVTITQTTCNSVTVNWTPPTDNGNAGITQYRVLVYKDSESHVVHANVTTMTTHRVTSLMPDTNYTVEIAAENVGGFGNGSTNFITKQIGTKPITVLAEQSRKVNITISGSGEVYSCTLNEQTMDITSGQTVQLTRLTPNTTYTVNCLSVNDSCLDATTTTFMTALIPGVVNNLTRGLVSVSEDGSSIKQNISWYPPVSGAAMTYLITYSMRDSNPDNASKSNSTRNTSIVLTLSVPEGHPDMVVYIWVAVVTKSKEQGNFEKLRIDYSIPMVPMSIVARPLSCQSVIVRWTPPTNSGGLPLTGYIVRYGDDKEQAAEDNATTVTLEGLSPATTYNITVAARNAIGEGTESTPVGVMTEPRRLGSFVTARAITSHSVMVNTTQKEGSSNCNLSASLHGQQMFVPPDKVQDLSPDTNYTLTCDVYDSSTSFNSCIYINTYVLTKPAKVLSVRAVPVRPSDIRGDYIHQNISWRRPDNHTHITHYLVQYVVIAKENIITTVNPIVNSTVLMLPIPDTTTAYRVWVAAVSEAGQGMFSDRVDFSYSRPGAPTGVTVKEQSCVTLKVTWSSPDHTGGLPINGYNISYTDVVTTTVNGSAVEQMALLRHLSPGTAYKLKVHAVNVIGQGQKTMTTVSTNHRAAGYVNATANSAHSILLSHNITVPGVYYLCKVYVTIMRGKEVNKNVTTQPTTVTGLLPDTAYRVDCVAYHSDGVEACLEANTTVTTFSDKVLSVISQGMVMKFNATVATIRQVITWTAPLNFRNITHYLVKYGKADEINGPSDVNVMTERTEMNLTRAVLLIQIPQKQTPNYSVSYSVWVAAVSDQRQGTFSDRYNFTYAKPNSPTRLKATNPTCNSITLTWSAPSYTGGVPLEGYEVRWRGRGSPLMTDGADVTAVTITRLSPKTSYTIDVRAVNAIGEGQRSEPATATTISQYKSLEVSVSSISSTSLHITAQPPPRLEMVEVNCNLTAKDNPSYIRTVSLGNRRDEGAQTLTDNLVPYTNYTATCLVFKDGVDQCYIGRDTTQTSTDKPSAPPQKVSPASISSHSFTMKWAPPLKGQQNGEIVSYAVEYREEGSNSTVVNTTRGMRYTAEDLATDRVYQFRVAANTVNGTGPFSEWSIVESIPTVTNLGVVNTTINSATITWDQPPRNYRVFLHGEATDDIPQSRVIQLVDVTGQTTHIVEGLYSFRNYSISVYLEFNFGQGNNATVTFQTQGRAPDDSPTHLTATPTSSSVTLQWSPPPVLSRNGILTHYVVGLANETWNTTQSHRTTGEQRKRREADSEGVGEETQSLTVEHLRPFTNYTWEVAAVSGFGTGPSSRKRFETHQDVPTQVESIRVNFTHKTITWAEPAEPNGIIVGYRVQYWELRRRDTAEEANTTAEDLVYSYSNFSAGVPHKVQVQAATVAGLGESSVVEEVLFSEEQAPTVAVSDITITRVNGTAVKVTWTALTLNDARGFPSYVISVTSKEKEVANVTTPSTSVVVGGLMPHTEYNVTVQTLTAGGRKEGLRSAPVTIEALPEPTDSSSPLTWILVVLIVVLIVAIVIFTVVVLVICRRYRSKNKTKPAGLWKDIPMKERGVLQEGIHAPLDLDPITDPEDRIQRKEAVLKENFCEHVQKLHQDKNALFVAEYQSITQTPEGVCDSAFKANVIKNRYVNIFPYDHSRVVLSERDSTGSDYINGVYIDAYNRANGYIATQGPTPDTLDDFWQMVWEHHAPVVVMLTKLIEKNKRKCEQYWATELNEPFKPGRNLSVTTLRCDTHPEFELRTIKVEKLTSKEDPLVVKHFLYTAWPDHSVPQYSVSIHRFIRQHVRPVYNDSSAPLIVHCSAGAGRTGTYMAIDTMMYQLEDRQNANIFEYVERMRTRRTQMVQNASQYIYIHDAINDYINCKDTTIVAHELRPRIEEMRQIDITTGSSGFVTQFSLLAEVSIKQCDADYAFAEEEDIMSKNRYRGLCPFSDKHLTKEDDSYVNASEVLGYCGQRNFIAAQTPMKNTEGDVWEMIWMEKCAAVVVLCDFVEGKDEMCSKFWPLKMSEPKTFGSIKVCLDDKAEQASYNEYHLTVSFTNHPDPLNVVVFHYLQWPRHGRPSIPPYLQLMGEVERSQHNATGPTLVMCDDGMSRTGVFITTMAEVERVKVQGEVDIFQTVKAARSERPHMVSTPVDYEVCHDVLVSYLESFDTYANFK